MDKLRICHVSLAVFPDHKDGSANFERNLYEQLKSRGHDIQLLTVKWDEGFTDPNIHALEVRNSRFLWVPKFTLYYRDFLKNHDYDIIQANGARGALPVLLSKKEYVTHIHDVGPFQARFSTIPGLKWLEKKNAQKAKIIMCGAQSAKKEISHYMNVDEEKIQVVSVGVDPIYTPHPKEGNALKLKMGLSGPVIFYVGRIAFYKGVGDIIKAYRIVKKKIPEAKLVIGGKPTLKMEHTVEKWKIENPDVIFTGIIPTNELPIYYSMSDMFVTYSYASEGFGITPVESLSCGTPVICSSMTAYMEVLKDHATYVQPQRPELLANAIIQHIKNPDIGLNQVKQAGVLLENYSWTKVADRVEKVYQDVL